LVRTLRDFAGLAGYESGGEVFEMKPRSASSWDRLKRMPFAARFALAVVGAFGLVAAHEMILPLILH